MEEKTYTFGEDTINAPADMTPDQVKSVWMNVHPQLENAEFIANDEGTGGYFEVQVGTKG